MLLSWARNLKVEEWSQMVDVNIKGVLHGVGAVLAHMRERKSGHIFNISSDADRKASSLPPSLSSPCADVVLM